MADDVDRAKELEMQQRDAEIAHARNRQPQPEQINDEVGNVICIDCSAIIPRERLKAKPDAARCVECKSAYELTGRS